MVLQSKVVFQYFIDGFAVNKVKFQLSTSSDQRDRCQDYWVCTKCKAGNVAFGGAVVFAAVD